MLRRVGVWIDGVEVDEAVIDVEIDLPEGCELRYEMTSLAPKLEGELTSEIAPDDWACLAEHSVFSDEPGEL